MADDQERAFALLGIAATKETRDQPCPPDNIMSAFIENRVGSKTRAMMLSHFNRCEDCYLLWEQLGVGLEHNSAKAIKQHNTDKVGFFQKIENWLNSGVSWQMAVPGLALAILLVVNMSDTSKQNIYSDPAMAVVRLDTETLALSLNQLPVPWKDQTFGFSKSTYPIPAKAVGAGIWSAKSTFLNSDKPLPAQLVSDPAIDWQNSEWLDYYVFGQWLVSAWVLANDKHIKPPQWTLLNTSLKTLETGFKQRQQSEPEAEIVLQTIVKMKVNLDRLSQKQDFSAQSTLLREIDLGLQKLFL